MKPEHKKFLVENLRIEGLYAYGLPWENSLEAWEYIHTHNTIRIDRILTLHQIVMRGLMDKPGEFRKVPVWIRKRTPNPLFFPGTTEPLFCDHYEPTLKAKLVSAYIDRWLLEGHYNKLESHYLFESIHPFVDGNGRVGRFLWAWGRRLVGSDIIPMLDSFGSDDFYNSRATYYKAIQQFREQNVPKGDLHAGKIRSRQRRSSSKSPKRRSAAHATDTTIPLRPGKDSK